MKIILKLFVLSVGLLACSASHFVLRKGNNSNNKCQNYVILKSNRECTNSLFFVDALSDYTDQCNISYVKTANEIKCTN